MMKRLLILLALCSVIGNLCAQNPIISTWCTPDPAPYVHGDTVYLFADLDKDTATYFRMPAWQLYSSTDMVNWTFRGRPLSTATFRWARQGDNAWASQAVERGGKWYWYVACEDTTNHLHGIGVAVADHPDGPYHDAIGKPLVPGGWGYIDPTVFVDKDGSAWLFWGNNGLWYARLGNDMVSIIGDITPVDISDSTAFGPQVLKYDYGLGKKTMKGNYEEAPWVYRRGNLYYLEYAAGGVPEHWAYSTAHSIHGPWTYRGRVMNEAPRSFTIHGGAITVGGRSFMFYHNGLLPWGSGFRRSTAVEEFRYGRDGSLPFIPFTNHGVVRPLRHLNPYAGVEAETMSACSNSSMTVLHGKQNGTGETVRIKTDTLPTWNADGTRNAHYITGMTDGSWTKLRSVDMAEGARRAMFRVRNVRPGCVIEMHVDSLDGRLLCKAVLPSVGHGWRTVKASCLNSITGIHDVYLVYRGAASRYTNRRDGNLGFDFDEWQFCK